MFWKKKQPRTDMLIHETPNKRDAFRYTFAPLHGPVIGFCSKTVELIDISAGGVSFKNNGFVKGDHDRVTVRLGGADIKFQYTLCITIEILSIDAQNICHCLFETPNSDQTEAIHRFLLMKQKKDIQERIQPK